MNEVSLSLLKYLIVLYSPFHLKEALYGFSLAYLNDWHHYSCTLWPLLSKVRVI